MTRDDPILGTVRECHGCGEEWPLDDEFWHLKDGALNHAFPARCRACCVEYYAVRRRLALVEKRATWTPPEMAVEGRCNREMRSGALCGRLLDHDHRCRSQWAMMCDARRQKRRAA